MLECSGAKLSYALTHAPEADEPRRAPTENRAGVPPFGLGSL